MSAEISDDKEDMFSINEIDYESMLEDEVVLNEIIVCGTICKRTNKRETTDKLSIMWTIDKEDSKK